MTVLRKFSELTGPLFCWRDLAPPFPSLYANIIAVFVDESSARLHTSLGHCYRPHRTSRQERQGHYSRNAPD